MSALIFTAREEANYHRFRAEQEMRQAKAASNPAISSLHAELASRHLEFVGDASAARVANNL